MEADNQQKNTIKPKHAKVAAMVAAGGTCRDIAKAVGYKDHSTISRIASKPEIKALIEQANNAITTKALNNVIERTVLEQEASLTLTKHMVNGDANTTRLNPLQYEKFLDRTTKTGNEILKSMGILASHSMNVQITNLYQDNSTTILSPVVSDMLQGKLNQLSDIEEVEVIEND